MTLIALGIIVSYTYSFAATFFFTGDVFYEAAAMLTLFSLAGHCMEMRSRFATGKAVIITNLFIRRLLGLARPTQALSAQLQIACLRRDMPG